MEFAQDFKTRFDPEKKTYTAIIEMSCSILVRCSLNYRIGVFATESFLGTFVDFLFMMFSQERIRTFDVKPRKN